MEVKEVAVHGYSNRKSAVPDEQHNPPQLLPDVDQPTRKLHSSMVVLDVEELKGNMDMPDNSNSRNHLLDYHAASAEVIDGRQK